MKTNWRRRVYRKTKHLYKFPENWAEIRRQIWERDNYTCFRCLKKNKRGTGLTVHHIMPREFGGSENEENLITLCRECHDFVEVNDLKSLVEIEASLDLGIAVRPIKDADDKIENFERPAWHQWVYGGSRNPLITE